ncbi:S-adenosyl-L-methionine-dependent methyltransferase [Collybia nuda]|uniref:Leucine carboxyl methyltransferase 1 n=1 Tax=Collybia nuda TaxID=64659 RepID=A0A9P5YA60_9AGAR|nr:S-adenosyl-L-methionine-dependent methyltransferase [Collybia nuda]
MFPPPSHRDQDPDNSIRLTDTDAAVARLSAAQKQYFHDPFIKYFVPRAHLQPPRPPLINVGTFVRSTAIDNLVENWLLSSERAGQRCQIVSFGSGSDTRFWRIAAGPHKDTIAKYIEIDFPEITSKKALAIRKSDILSQGLGDSADILLCNGGTTLHSPVYHLLSVDLRLPPATTLESVLISPSPNSTTGSLLSVNLPTLLLFECVLVYMSPSASSALLRWFVKYFSSSTEQSVLGSVVYEMFGLGDAFGRVMVNNLRARRISLPGVEPYPNIQSLPSRFLDAGFTTGFGLNLREIREGYIDPAELKRISTLEMLDEVEELELLLEHYAISWGVFSTSPDLNTWEEWGLVQKKNMVEEDLDQRHNG